MPMLAEEFLRVGIDFGWRGGTWLTSKTSSTKWSSAPCVRPTISLRQELEGAHEALPDTLATVDVFLAQLERYKDHTVLNSRGETVGPVPSEVEALANFANAQQRRPHGAPGVRRRWRGGVPVWQHTGKRVKDVPAKDPGYFGWMMEGFLVTPSVFFKVKDGEL